MFEVKDGVRTLQFNGSLLGKSSSWRRGSSRWIEFELYRTDNGSYILARVGVSLIYHTASCPLVKRYNLSEVNAKGLESAAIPCSECHPTRSAVLVFPETQRHWAQMSEGPKAVLEALYKFDDGGARYLTNVAERLLVAASSKDTEIESVYKVELIP